MSAPESAIESPPPVDAPASDALSRLVRDVQATGTSFQQMADRARARGHEISKPYFQKLAAGNVSTAPDPKRLLAIAAGIQVPPNVVKRAAALQYLNYQATELAGYDEEVRIIVAHLAGKSRPELRRWRAMIEAEESVADDE
jgi:hypothetical protein